MPGGQQRAKLPRLSLSLPGERRRSREESSLSQEEIALTLDRLGDFRDQQGEFEEFLQVVNTDIETKTEYWKSLKTSTKSNETGAGKNFRTYVAIQVFMLRRYARRIARFQKSTRESIKRICVAHTSNMEGEEVQQRSLQPRPAPGRT